MTSSERIETLNATGAGGTRIARATYDAFRAALLEAIPRDPAGVAFRELPRRVAPLIPAAMKPRKGSVSWYVTVVKLDLEARGLIERVPRARPQRLRRP